MAFSLLASFLQIDTLQYIQNLNENISSIKNIVETSNSTIANEISVVNCVLTAFTIVLAIIGIILGWYINWLYKKVSKINNEIIAKEKYIKSIAKEVEDLNNKIQNDISGLYQKLRKEETLTLLHRLELEPKDINNLSELLLSRTLEDNGFTILKNAYINLLKLGNEADKCIGFNQSYRNSYLLQFFQHYMFFAIQDEDLRDSIMNYLDVAMRCAFKRDIIKSTEDFCKALSASRVSFDRKNILVKYLKAINQSNFKNLIELKDIFQNTLNKDLLVDAIEQCTSEQVYLELFDVQAPTDTPKEHQN